jgi:carbon-monoxide dehydrogenase medium subunit
VGGSIAHADPAAEWPALLLALDGELDAVGPSGRRTIPARELFVTYFTTSLGPDEIVVEVRIPLWDGDRSGSAFVELARRHGDFAIAGAAAAVGLGADGSISEARLALIGVGHTALRPHAAETSLRGARPEPKTLSDAAGAAVEGLDPVSDVHGSGVYRRHVAGVVVRRALQRAVDRARGAHG